jgi:hypothetical protein
MNSVGTFRYSPTLNGSLMRRDGGTTRWWLIIDCDPELGRFSRHLLVQGTYRTRTVQSPLWGTHISVVRGEEPPLKAAWERLNGQEVEFEYEPVIRETDGYLWVPIRCEAALTHRQELGLQREPDPPLHLTIGNLKHEESV